MNSYESNLSPQQLETFTNQFKRLQVANNRKSGPTINIYQRSNNNSRPLLSGAPTHSSSSSIVSDEDYERAFQITEHPTMSTAEKVTAFKKLTGNKTLPIMRPRSKDNNMSLMATAATIHPKHPELFDEIMSHSSLVKSLKKNDGAMFRHAKPLQSAAKDTPLAYSDLALNRKKSLISSGAKNDTPLAYSDLVLNRKKSSSRPDVSLDYMNKMFEKIDAEEKQTKLFRKQYKSNASASTAHPSIDPKKASDINARMTRAIMESEHITPAEKQTALKGLSASPFYNAKHTMKDGKTLGDIINSQRTKSMVRSSANPNTNRDDDHHSTFVNFYKSFTPCDSQYKQTYRILKDDSISDAKKIKHLNNAINNGLNIHQKMSDGSNLMHTNSKGSAVYEKINGLYRDSFAMFKRSPKTEMKKTDAPAPVDEERQLEKTQKLHDAINSRDLDKCKKYIKAGACPHLEIDGVSGHSLLSDMNKIPFSRDLGNLFKEQPSSSMTKSGMHCFGSLSDKVDQVIDEIESDVESIGSDVEDAFEEIMHEVEEPFKKSSGCSGCSGKKSKKSKSKSKSGEPHDRDSEYM